MNQPHQRADIVFAIFKNQCALIGAKWRTLQDSIAHFLFVRSVDTGLAEIQKRTTQAVETFFPVFGFGGAVIDVMAKLDIGIKAAGRLRPAKPNVAAELGCRQVADEQGAGVEPVRRTRFEFILPLANDAA
jgi:hypothetical protein